MGRRFGFKACLNLDFGRFGKLSIGAVSARSARFSPSTSSIPPRLSAGRLSRRAGLALPKRHHAGRVMDPLAARIFISLTAGLTRQRGGRAAIQAAAAAGGLVVVFALFGRLVLDYLHVSVESLTIAGGLSLLVALQMLRGEEFAQAIGKHRALRWQPR